MTVEGGDEPSGVDGRFAAVVAGAPLSYVSDYLSFVGGDASGRVCFALDTNRGHDAAPPRQGEGGLQAQVLQAEHAYAVLHDEQTGWVPLHGVARYPHPGPDVTALPDSPWFSFRGHPDTGWFLRSTVDDLALTVEPLADRMVGQDASTLFVLRSAAAVLRWRGRTLPGRVVYEGLATTAGNLLSRRTFSGLAGLEFLYLSAGPPQEPVGDVYLQKTLAPAALAGLPAQTGFAAGPTSGADADTVLRDLRLATTGHRPGLGLYRWPTRWSGGWSRAGAGALAGSARVELSTVTRTRVGQYGIAGFGMAVVTGTATDDAGTVTPLYGFGELLAVGPLLRALTRQR